MDSTDSRYRPCGILASPGSAAPSYSTCICDPAQPPTPPTVPIMVRSPPPGGGAAAPRSAERNTHRFLRLQASSDKMGTPTAVPTVVGFIQQRSGCGWKGPPRRRGFHTGLVSERWAWRVRRRTVRGLDVKYWYFSGRNGTEGRIVSCCKCLHNEKRNMRMTKR